MLGRIGRVEHGEECGGVGEVVGGMGGHPVGLVGGRAGRGLVVADAIFVPRVMCFVPQVMWRSCLPRDDGSGMVACRGLVGMVV